MSSQNVSPLVPVEHHDPDHSRQAHEDVVLPALVEVKPADHAAAGTGQIHLPDGLLERTRPRDLGEPATLVGVTLERHAAQPFDHRPRLSRTKSLTA
jgi:hypothetical protein